MTDNILHFPKLLNDELNEKQWKQFQAEFYLDCFLADKGYPAAKADELEQWLLQAKIKADMENPFFRGWLVRRLSEEMRAEQP